MYMWFKYVSDEFYGISNDVKSTINSCLYNGNGSLVAHKGVAILREIVCLLSPGCFYFKNRLLEGYRDAIDKQLKCDVNSQRSQWIYNSNREAVMPFDLRGG